MWDLSEPVDDFDLINRVYRGRQATMNAEDLIAYDDTQRQVVEHVGEVMPDVGTSIFPSAFSVEAVRLCDASRFMISSDEVNAPRPA